MIEPFPKYWIRLFSFHDRSNLEQALNEFIREYEDVSIDVWTNEGMWFAQVRYSFPEPPTYCENND